LPGHRLLLEQLSEQIELFLEQRLVLRQIEPEQRKRLGERAAPQRHLGASVRGGVDGGKTLEQCRSVAAPDPIGECVKSTAMLKTNEAPPSAAPRARFRQPEQSSAAR
jgi:hypothetical protein